MKIGFIVFLWMIVGSISPLWAGEDLPDTVYFDRSREGWFWYLQMKPDDKRGIPEKKRKPERTLPPTLKEMREKAELLLGRAVEAPTEANVAAYMAYQYLLVERAEAFARTWQRALWQRPEFDSTVENPVVTAGLSAARFARRKKQDLVLSRLAGSSGLLYFFSGECPLCEIQSPILASFAEAYGFSVVPISLDGVADPVFQGVKIDHGAAGRLGVEKLPAIFLARPPSEVIRVGTGLLSMEDLAGRLYRLNESIKDERDESQENKISLISNDRDPLGDLVDPLLESARRGRSPGPAR
ncbi:MAG: conjugal transfer protein TraF [Nitrospiria bacterium]